MAVPKFEDFLYPFMKHLMEKDSNKADMVKFLANHFNLSKEDLELKTKGGYNKQMYDRVGWSLQWLRRALFVTIPSKDVWRITQRGHDYMMFHDDLRESDLMEYPEFAEYSGLKNNRMNKAGRDASQSDGLFILHNDNWLEIVETVKPLIESIPPYTTYYNTVVTCFRLLGWKKSKGTIVTFPSNNVKVKEGLIFLNVDKENLHIPIVPLDLNESYSEELRQEVLFKAMDEWNCFVGLVFSDTVQVFYKDVSSGNDPVCISNIRFDEKDKYGNALCNLLSFSTFNLRVLEQFCKKEYEKIPSGSNIRKRLFALSQDSSLIASMIKNMLITEGFSDDVIDKELVNYSYRIKVKGLSIGSNNESSNKDKTKGTRDTTRFSIDGKNFYNKKHFVLVVVRQYIKEHPDVTLNELEKVFPSELSSKTRGVVRQLSLVQEWVKENPDVKSRYFMASDEILTLGNGDQIVVHNQWGGRFPLFLKVAKEIFNIVSDRPYPGINGSINKEIKKDNEEKHGIVISADSFSKFKGKK